MRRLIKFEGNITEQNVIDKLLEIDPSFKGNFKLEKIKHGFMVLVNNDFDTTKTNKFLYG